MQLDLFSLVVDDYDAAIDFFVDALQFTLIENEPSVTNDGRVKRWVVVRPPNGGTGLLLAAADGERKRRLSATNLRAASVCSCEWKTLMQHMIACCVTAWCLSANLARNSTAKLWCL